MSEVKPAATADDPELLTLQNMLKLAEVSNRVIDATQADNAAADALVPTIISLGKSAGLVTSTVEEENLRQLLQSRAGTTKVAHQLLLDMAAQQKQAAATTPPPGFSVAGQGNGRPMPKQASHGADGEDDVIGKIAASLL